MNERDVPNDAKHLTELNAYLWLSTSAKGSWLHGCAEQRQKGNAKQTGYGTHLDICFSTTSELAFINFLSKMYFMIQQLIVQLIHDTYRLIR